MKNFKLLLATTAILSMGAMAVNATDGLNVTLTGKVTLVDGIRVKSVTALDFGKVAATTLSSGCEYTIASNTSTTSVTVNKASTEAGDYCAYFGGASVGKIEFERLAGGIAALPTSSPSTIPASQKYVISLPDRIDLGPSCGEIVNLSVTAISDGTTHYGGTLKVYASADGAAAGYVNCQATAVATVIPYTEPAGD